MSCKLCSLELGQSRWSRIIKTLDTSSWEVKTFFSQLQVVRHGDQVKHMTNLDPSLCCSLSRTLLQNRPNRWDIWTLGPCLAGLYVLGDSDKILNVLVVLAPKTNIAGQQSTVTDLRNCGAWFIRIHWNKFCIIICLNRYIITAPCLTNRLNELQWDFWSFQVFKIGTCGHNFVFGLNNSCHWRGFLCLRDSTNIWKRPKWDLYESCIWRVRTHKARPRRL